MHASVLILSLTGSLAAALIMGFITHRLGLSPIVGYLLAGFIVGPYTPGFVADRALANEFAEIGVILLMFGVGLHFHIKDLLAVRNIAIVGAVGQSVVATLLGTLAGRAFAWSWSGSVVFGLALSVASTVMLTRVLSDNQDLQTRTGRIAIGWLVVEDIFTVIVLVLLPAIFVPSAGSHSPMQIVGITLIKLVLLVAFTVTFGNRLIPRVLKSVAVTRSRELFTLTVLVLALGIAVGSALTFGVSMALGAFLAGMIVGQSEFSFRAASDALPMRDAFAVLFFVSVGMLFDPHALTNSPSLLFAALFIVLIGKPLAAFLLVTLLGYGASVGIGVAVALAQIGEFSLILATIGDQLQILPGNATNLIVATSIISLGLNPILYRTTGWWKKKLSRIPMLWAFVNRTVQAVDNLSGESNGSAFRAVVVGYGPIGQTVARLLRDGGIEPVIIDTNWETTRSVRAQGYRVVFGDATNSEVLEAADTRNAVALVVSGPTSEAGAEIIQLARTMNPTIRILARSYYLKETAIMRSAGADQVFSGEGEVALAMTEYILNTLGATPEQIDRERQRVREEVF